MTLKTDFRKIIKIHPSLKFGDTFKNRTFLTLEFLKNRSFRCFWSDFGEIGLNT